MRRRHLVATATAGALTSLLASLSVATAPLLAAAPATAEAVSGEVIQGFGSVELVRAREPRKIPLVIAHRGASAYRAEHTVEAYRLAVQMGADYIEADLVMTRDGELVARHEHELSATTDVASRPEFASRRRTKLVNGAPATGWFTEDFTLAEVRTLHAVPRKARRTTGSSALARPEPTAPATAPLTIPTLQDVVDLALAEQAARNRPVGLYLELKLPGYFGSLGLTPEARLAEVLRRNRLAGSGAPVFVESFEADSLRMLRHLVQAPLIQLTWGLRADTAVADWLAQTRSYAAGIGLPRELLTPGNEIVRTAHQLGLEVHVFTLTGVAAEYLAYYAMGIDGVFTDNPDIAITARTR